MRIVLIGGNGFIGTAFVRYAQQKEVDIISCDYRKPVKTYDGVNYVTIETENMDFYRKLLSKDDIVIILKWKGVPALSLENSKELIENNIVGTMLLIEACIEKNVKKIIFSSSGGAIYGDTDTLPINENTRANPISIYAVQKLMVENYLEFVARTKKMNILILRIANPYGPGQEPFNGQGIVATFLACNLLGREAEIWGDGRTVRDYLYIDELAECMFLCAEKNLDSGIYNIGSGLGTSIFDICKLIEETTNVPLHYVIKKAGSNQVKDNVLDCSKIEKCTGWKVSIDMRTGINKMIQAWNGTNFCNGL